jgi:hypothetical protein
MGKTYLFSPYADTVISDCKGIQRVHQIVAGTTVFDSTACTLRSTELLILGMRQIVGMQDIDKVSNFDITLSKMSSVLEDITISDTMLLGNQTKLLVEYLAAAKTENVELKKATDELKKFKAVSFLSNYTLFDFDLDVPLGMSNAVTGAYVGLAFLFFLFSLLCCCSCKCIRTAMFSLVKGLCRGIWYILRKLGTFLWHTCVSTGSGVQSTSILPLVNPLPASAQVEDSSVHYEVPKRVVRFVSDSPRGDSPSLRREL